MARNRPPSAVGAAHLKRRINVEVAVETEATLTRRIVERGRHQDFERRHAGPHVVGELQVFDDNELVAGAIAPRHVALARKNS